VTWRSSAFEIPTLIRGCAAPSGHQSTVLTAGHPRAVRHIFECLRHSNAAATPGGSSRVVDSDDRNPLRTRAA